MPTRLFRFAVVLSYSAAFGVGQPQPAFEVASLCASGPRLANVGPLPVGGTITGGPGTADPSRIAYSRVPLQTILINAFEIPIDQLSGPDWIVSEPFDMVANVPPGATKHQVALMLHSLLVERMGLAFHRQSKNFEAYELMVAAGGPKPKATQASVDVPPPQKFQVRAGKDGYPDLPPGARQASIFREGATYARFRDYSAAELAHWLGARLGTLIPGALGPDSGNIAPARIIDKTGLTAKYDFTLVYAGAILAMERLPPGAQGRLDSSGPSIFTALEKQLGLKLKKNKIAVDVIVIDHIDRVPVEN